MGVIINLGSTSKTENQFKKDTLGTVQLLLVISRGLVGGGEERGAPCKLMA